MTHNLTHTGQLLESTGEETADGIGCLGLHCGGDVGVGVQREACGVVAQHGGQGFDVYTVLESQDRECVSEAVEGKFPVWVKLWVKRGSQKQTPAKSAENQTKLRWNQRISPEFWHAVRDSTPRPSGP